MGMAGGLSIDQAFVLRVSALATASSMVPTM
jgi:hypothetical protein